MPTSSGTCCGRPTTSRPDDGDRLSEFNDFVAEVLEPFGPVRIRRMFGGFGVFRDNLMFGLIAADTLYFKADKTSAKHFIEQGSVPFEYAKQGRLMQLSYFSAPEEIFDDEAAARHWAEMAYDAALRARAPGAQSQSRATRRKRR
jgi:DNA transformation protein